MSIYIGKEGQQLGPYEIEGLLEAFSAGEVALTDLAWSDGEAGWTVLSEYAEKKGIVLKIASSESPFPPPPPPLPPLALPSQDAIDVSAQPKPKLTMGSGRRPRCPKCRSENVELVSSVIAAGTSTRTVEGGGGGYSTRGEWVSVSTSSVETVKTDLAERLEEETNELLVSGSRTYTASSFIAVGISAFISYRFGAQGWLSHALYFLGPMFAIMAILMATGLIDKWEKVDSKADEENKKIDKRLYCHACGDSFSPE